MERPEKKIADIDYGMAIDHIPADSVTAVYGILREGIGTAYGEFNMFMGNVDSRKMAEGRKGIIKVDGLHLPEEAKTLHEICILAPQATVNWIEGRKVVKKKVAKDLIPSFLETRIAECENTNCIIHEEAPGKFFVVSKSPLIFRCYYCTREFAFEPQIKSEKI